MDKRLSSLECVTLGGISAAFSFVCAGYLQTYIEVSRKCLILEPFSNFFSLQDHPETPPSVLWQIPQFFFLMLGEVWISIPGLQFSYTQAPPSMKSVLTAAWFINNAIGNLIVVIITELKPIQSESILFFLYAALMFLGIIIFTSLATKYEDRIVVLSENDVIDTYIYVESVECSNLEENKFDIDQV